MSDNELKTRLSYELARRQGIAEGIEACIMALSEVYIDAADWLASDDGDEVLRRALREARERAKRMQT